MFLVFSKTLSIIYQIEGANLILVNFIFINIGQLFNILDGAGVHNQLFILFLFE